MSEGAPTATEPTHRQRHVWDYWRIVWEGRYVLTLVLGTSLALALVGTYLMAPKYKAVVMVEVSLAPTPILGTDSERMAARMNFYEQEAALKTEFVRIRTREMLQAAMDEHQLVRKVPGLAKGKDPIDRLRRQVTADAVPQSNVATITVSWWDSEAAATLANAIAETYVASDLAYRVKQLRARAERLDASAEERGGVRRSMLERELATIRSRPDLETLLSLSSLSESVSLQTLRETLSAAERDLEGVSGTHGRASPLYRSKAAEVGELRRQVNDAVIAGARLIEAELRSMGVDPDAPVMPLNSSEPVAAMGQQAVAAKYEAALRDKVAEAQLVAGLAEPKARIIDRALPPDEPYAPKLPLNLALAFVVGVSLGGGILFFREYLDTSVRTLEDVEQDLGLTMLAVIPAYTKEEPPEVKEAFQTLRTGLLFSSPEHQDRIVLVTSSGPREGKSTACALLARSIAAAGETVIVVDADLRRPSVARLLGVNAQKGLSNHLAEHAGGSDWKSLVVRAANGLDVLPTGPLPPNPVTLLGTPRFVELLRQLKAAYAWVLVDSPPVSSVSDSLVLASVADQVIIVVRHDVTDRDVVRRALGRLAGVKARVAGAVLTGVDMARDYNREFYFGRFFYGHYYGVEGTSGPPPASGLQGLITRLSRRILKG